MVHSYATAREKERADRRLLQAGRRVDAFAERYPQALQLACYGAFPLTLTSDLLYCLRENFVPECPWYGVADVLLSGLCDRLGHDLYGMAGETRQVLLARLKEDYGTQTFADLQNFMVEYLKFRLGLAKSQRQQVLERPQWTALAYLKPGGDRAVVEAIKQELQRLAAGPDARERFQMVALAEDYADLLSEQGYRPILLEFARRAEAGEAIVDSVDELATALGVEWEWLEFQAAYLEEVDAKAAADTGDVLVPFAFETAQVARSGQVTRTAGEAYCLREPLGKGLVLEMVAIAGGTFDMGSPETEPERDSDEGPQHKVTVPPFFLGRYPVTQAQWKFVAGLPQVNIELKPDPSNFKGSDRPVEQVSWHEAVEFCDRLSKQTGREYRLPSEAEWEYACRAGTSAPFHFGETLTTEVANYNGNYIYGDGPKGKYRQETTPVGEFPANAFGLQDMHGNVYEWCADRWHDSYDRAPTDGSAWVEGGNSNLRVRRGGSWFDDPWWCRSACRYDHGPGDRFNYIGFRVVCSAPRT